MITQTFQTALIINSCKGFLLLDQAVLINFLLFLNLEESKLYYFLTICPTIAMEILHCC